MISYLTYTSKKRCPDTFEIETISVHTDLINKVNA